MGKLYNLKPYFDTTNDFSFKSNLNIRAGVIYVDYTLSSKDSIRHLYLPNFNEVKREHELWKSTCFECFIFYPEGDYYELNIAPSGGWNSYYFSSYKEDMRVAEGISLTHLSSSFSDHAYDLEASFQYIDKRYPSSIQICAVLFDLSTNELNYWAIEHNLDKPDFHLQEISSEYKWV